MTLIDWQERGFAASPECHTASGIEQIFRAYSDERFDEPIATAKSTTTDMVGSSLLSNCFFVPMIKSSTGAILNLQVDPTAWSATFLEINLNAWMWGNRFEKVCQFQLGTGARYWIGPIAQEFSGTFEDHSANKQSNGKPPPTGQVQSWTPIGLKTDELRQVVIDDSEAKTERQRRIFLNRAVTPVHVFKVAGAGLGPAGHA